MIRAKTISVETAAKIIRKDPQYVRLGLQQGRFPFGTAIQKPNGRWTYNIIEPKVYEYAGINMKEEKGGMENVMCN